MPIPFLVIIGGPPGSGKTTLGRRIAADLKLPFVHKDGIKEALFGRLGGNTVEASRNLGRASYDVLYHFMETLLRAGCSHVVESNFDAGHASPVFRDFGRRFAFAPIQVLCRADGDTLLERVRARAASGERHPAHLDAVIHRETPDLLRREALAPLAVEGPVIEIDTTDFACVDHDQILGAVRAAVAAAARERLRSEESV